MANGSASPKGSCSCRKRNKKTLRRVLVISSQSSDKSGELGATSIDRAAGNGERRGGNRGLLRSWKVGKWSRGQKSENREQKSVATQLAEIEFDLKRKLRWW